MVEVRKYVLGPLDTNAYLIIGPTYEAILIDAPPGSLLRITYLIDRGLIKLKYVLITHAHTDHIAEAQAVKEVSGAKLIMGSDDLALIPLAKSLAEAWRIKWFNPIPDVLLRGDGTLDLNWLKIKFLHTPGHTPGSISYYIPELKIVFTGDTLFKGTVGRTDIPLASKGDLMLSLKKLVKELPKDTKVMPGHGKETTIGDEVRSNPFVKYALEFKEPT